VIRHVESFDDRSLVPIDLSVLAEIDDRLDAGFARVFQIRFGRLARDEDSVVRVKALDRSALVRLECPLGHRDGGPSLARRDRQGESCEESDHGEGGESFSDHGSFLSDSKYQQVAT